MSWLRTSVPISVSIPTGMLPAGWCIIDIDLDGASLSGLSSTEVLGMDDGNVGSVVDVIAEGIGKLGGRTFSFLAQQMAFTEVIG